MTRIAILSDLHGNMPAIEKVIDDLKTRQVERIFCLGDLISGPLWPKETIEFLKQRDWTIIRGNHDRQVSQRKPEDMGPSDAYARQFLNAEDLAWLGSLPAALEVDETFLLCHGSPAKDTTYLLDTIKNGRIRLSTPKEMRAKIGDPRLPVILCGHSHFPRVVQMENGPLIVNPGSVGVQAYEDDSGYFVVENGSPHARYAIIESSEKGWKTEIILVPYDHQLAVDQARKNHRPDYEVALLSGFMHDDTSLTPVFS
jgi:putative phosphoesterase